MRLRLIVAGINTEVGKTLVSAILTEALGGCYWKPVQCGLPTDSDWVRGQISSGSISPSTFTLATPASPHFAARKEGVRIDAKELIPPPSRIPLIIEGTGGLLSPLNETETWADAAINWKGKWILVHRHYLGSLNHFTLTIEAMKKRNIDLLGVIFNGEGDLETEEMLLKKGECNCLGRLKWEKKWGRNEVATTAKEWRPSLLKILGL